MLEIRRTLSFVVAVFLLAWTVGVAGPEEEPSPDAQRHLDFLDWETGVWDASIRMDSMDGGEWQSFSGEQTDRMGACGAWLVSNMTSRSVKFTKKRCFAKRRVRRLPCSRSAMALRRPMPKVSSST